MKKIIFFDLDGTIHNKTKKEIPKNTIKLLKELSLNKNIELGLATGRAKNNVSMLGDLINFFKYKVFINGAIAYKEDKLVYSNPINKKELFNIYKKVTKRNIMTGFIYENKECIINIKENVKGINYNNIKNFTEKDLTNKEVFQLWIFDVSINTVEDILKNTNLSKFSWHESGYDIVSKNTNKINAINELLKNETNYKLITVGDGENDIDMIKMANIGIAMENSRFNKLKEAATYIAPHIDEDKMYDFFKEIKLIS